MALAFSSDDFRRTERDDVEYQVQIWGATLPPSSALITNISPSGCMLRCDQMVSIGESLSLDVPCIGSLRGMVIWSAGARIGVEFDAAMPLAVYEQALAQMKAPSTNHLLR